MEPVDKEWVKDCVVRVLYNKKHEMIAGYISAPNLSRTFKHFHIEENRLLVEKRIFELVSPPRNISCLWINNTKTRGFDNLRLWLDIAIYSFFDSRCGGIVCSSHASGLHEIYKSFGFVCVWEQDSPRNKHQKFKIWVGKRSHTVEALFSIVRRYRKKRKKSSGRKMKLENNKRTRMLLTATLAATLWGSWAFYANRGTSGIQSCILQVILSFSKSLVLTYTVEYLYDKLPRSVKFLSPYLPCLIFAFISYLAHYAVGTTNLWLTVLPPFLVSVTYLTFYVMLIGKEKKHLMTKVDQAHKPETAQLAETVS